MSEPSVSAWCVNTRQSRRSKRRGILRAMLQKERRPLGNQSREGRSVEKEDSSSRRRLTARPKHPDFRERASLRGAVKERRSWSNRKTQNKVSSLFCARFDDMGCSKLSKEGSPRASFSRRRGLPKAGSRTKHPASALHLEASARAAFREMSRKRLSREAPSSLWAASSQLLDVTVFPALTQGAGLKTGESWSGKKSGKKKAAQSLARGSADDAARWHGSFRTRTAGTPARGSSTVKSRASFRKECPR